jgi:hypothetical protein
MLSILNNLAVKKTSQIGMPNLFLLTFVCLFLFRNQSAVPDFTTKKIFHLKNVPLIAEI